MALNMTAKASYCFAVASSVILTLVTPGEAGPQDAQTLHTAFSFWTHPLQGSEGDIYYTDNLKHMMTVTTSFSRWSCFRGDVRLNSRGNWSGGFMCLDDQADLSTSVDVECSPNKITPPYVQMMSVHEKGRDGHDTGIQFIASCTTGTAVPQRGEIK
jgi:hypothetical protein